MQKVFTNIYLSCVVWVLLNLTASVISQKHYTRTRKLQLREDVRRMFQHAYDGYLRHASDYDELRPLTCDGHDTWGSYSLTLIDALDTLATMGNFTEFSRVCELLTKKMNFDRDINVSVFETNIRIVGGLLSAHLLSRRAGLQLEQGWPCEGPLLRMAEDVARRLLPAFNTNTGMPYGTVNLRYGVPKGETPVTCTAGVGTFLIEFGTLTRLTGKTIYEDVALQAIYALWERRSPIGLFGNHIDVQTGRWTALDSGIGAGVDSLFEYLVKGALLLNRPELLKMFHQSRTAIDKYMRKDDWYVWVGMNKGHVTLPVFQSLEAFWPGILSIVGDTEHAMRTIARYISVWKKYGFLPEFYNIPAGEAAANREVYPLRPELVESAMYMYRATKNEYLLELGEQMLESIEFSAKTKCGYATIRNVVTHEKENRMESFFLAETSKYLYLLFDEENFLHNNGGDGVLMDSEDDVCVVEAGAYIFNTEAHPMDMSALYCCHDVKDDIFAGMDIQQFSAKSLMKAVHDGSVATQDKWMDNCKPTMEPDVDERPSTSLAVDIEVFDEFQQPAADLLVENFERIRMERDFNQSVQRLDLPRNQLTVSDLDEFFEQRRENFPNAEETLTYVLNFMSNFTMDVAFIRGLQLYDGNITSVLGTTARKEYESRLRTLWQLYDLEQQFAVNIQLIQRLGLLNFQQDDDDMRRHFTEVLDSLDNMQRHNQNMTEEEYYGDETADSDAYMIRNAIYDARVAYEMAMMNTTAMQEFILRIYQLGTSGSTLRYTPLLKPEELETLNAVELVAAGDRELFKYTRRIVDFRKRMSETVDRLQTLMQDAKSKPITAIPDKKLKSLANSAATSTKSRPSGSSSSTGTRAAQNEALKKQKDEKQGSGSGSVWAQFVQTILRKTTVQRVKFDEALLLEKTRKSLEKYAYREVPYQLFTCRRPEYIGTLAYRDHYPEAI